MMTVELERIEVLELLGMVMGHIDAASGEPTPRLGLLYGIRDRLAAALREDS